MVTDIASLKLSLNVLSKLQESMTSSVTSSEEAVTSSEEAVKVSFQEIKQLVDQLRTEVYTVIIHE